MNVYDAAIQRIELIFNKFDNIYVSFSGGKDSGILLNLCIDYIRKHNLKRRIGVFHIDYEAQYEFTTDYVDRTLASNEDIFDVYRVCVPFKVPTSCSMSESYWRPWDESKKKIWVRDLPPNGYQSSEFDFYDDSMWDYDFQQKFAQWLHLRNNATKTCCLIGIRTQESLNRWRAIYSDRNYKTFEDLKWTKEVYPNVYNAYPIFDWLTKDVWIANGKRNWEYNKLYDLYYQAGLSIDQMRVASPFISTAQASLQLYKVIEPHTWGKLVSRVNGVNFTGIYGGTTAMGWQSIKIPEGHTWESYMYFLLDTLPKKAKENYLSKLKTSMEFWQNKGGVLSLETIKKLRSRNIDIDVQDSTNYKTSKLPVRMKYLDDIDINEFKEIPTYKRMCICIMKNDHLCKYMGFSQTKYEIEKRKKIMQKYKDSL